MDLLLVGSLTLIAAPSVLGRGDGKQNVDFKTCANMSLFCVSFMVFEEVRAG